MLLRSVARYAARHGDGASRRFVAARELVDKQAAFLVKVASRGETGGQYRSETETFQEDPVGNEFGRHGVGSGPLRLRRRPYTCCAAADLFLRG